MTGFAAAFVWSTIQISIFAGLVSLFILLGGRRLSGICGDVLGIAMGLILAFTLFAVLPIPSWFSQGQTQLADTDPASSNNSDAESSTSQPLINSTTTQNPSAEIPTPSDTPFAQELNTTLRKWWSEFQYVPPIETEAATPERRFPWLWVVVVPLFLLVAIGVIKFLLGFVAVTRLRRNSQVIDEVQLSQLIRAMSDEIGVKRNVKVLESNEILSAATVGWIEPVILLPQEWREWNESELSSAIAHELAHVSGNDYAVNLIAQVSVALNFFNPIVHWLGRELRVSQELIADEKAAAANGGRKTYLLTMAEMALKQDNNQLGWLAQPFLPTRTTFLRRIEMLKGNKKLHTHQGTLALGLARLSLLAIAVTCIGFRAPDVQSIHAQQPSDRNTAPDLSESWNRLEFVTDDTQYFVSADLEALRKHEAIDQLLKRFDEVAAKDGSVFFYDLSKAHTITLQLAESEPNSMRRVGLVLRTSETLPAIDTLDGELFTYRDHQCIDVHGPCIHLRDSNTIVFSTTRAGLKAMLDSPNGPQVTEWQKLPENLRNQPFFFAISQLGFESLPVYAPVLNMPDFETFAPLWRNARCLGMGFDFKDENAQVELLVQSKKAEDQEAVQESFDALMKLTSNMLDTTKVKSLKVHKRIQVAKECIENLTLSDSSSNSSIAPGQFKVTTQLEIEDWSDLVSFGGDTFLGSVQVTENMNNLRIIALAMHNYESAHGHFPAASTVAPGSQHAHSWRIAILPYMEYQDLHEKYRFNEPWNSEHNAKITAEMPDVFRHPAQERDSTSSGIYLFTGESTAFQDGKEPEFGNIIDGTSNTILAVQLNQDIHWAKPQDIEFPADDEAAVQFVEEMFGDGDEILTAFFDGSVRRVNRSAAEVFPALIRPNDGKIVQIPDSEE